MHVKRLLLLTCLLCLVSRPALSLSGADFLAIEVGARQLGMGGAGSVLPSDAMSLFYNPAMLALSSGYTLNVGHRKGLFDSSTEFVGGTMPLFGGYMGAAVITGLIGSEDKLTISGDKDGTLTALDMAGQAGYGMKLWQLYIGASGKFIYRQVGPETLVSFAGDVGTAVDIFSLMRYFGKRSSKSGLSPLPGNQHTLFFGTSFSNLGMSIDDTSLPMISRTGLWYTYYFHPMLKASAGTDFIYQTDLDSPYYQLGTELRVYYYFLLRSGFSLGGVGNRFAFGGGIDYPVTNRMHLAVNYADFPNPTGNRDFAVDLTVKFPFSGYRGKYVFEKDVPSDHKYRIKKPKFRVLVFNIENRSGKPALDQTKKTIESFLANVFKNSPSVQWISSEVTGQMIIMLGLTPEEVNSLEGKQRLAKATGSQLALSGYIDQPSEQSLVLTIKLENVNTGEVLVDVQKTATNNIEVLEIMDASAEALRKKVEVQKGKKKT